MCDHERDGAQRKELGLAVRMSDAMKMAGDEEGGRGCGVALMIEAVACVGKGWERASG